MDIWRRVPWDLLDLIDKPQPLPTEVSSWTNLSQRFGPAATALVILAGAWALGHLLLRLIQPTLERQTGERTFFACVLGLSAWSLLTLGLGWCGFLSRGLFGTLLGLCLVGEFGLRILHRQKNDTAHSEPPPGILHHNGWLFMVTPFLLCMILGSLLPSTDFDVLEYHFQGPKEYLQAGEIGFLPHNVYTSFPFGTEMLTLLAMVLLDDWYWGAVAGKAVLMCFGPLTGLGLFAAGCRWFTPRTGIYAAAIFLTTPWIYRISTIAYAEGGLSCYLFATLCAVMIGIDRFKKANGDQITLWQFFLAGLLAGTAMACKYPGVLSVVIPLGAAVVAIPYLIHRDKDAPFRDASRLAAVFALGTAVTVGPWLVKNTIETGNPVYPLVYSVFGGADWDAQLNAKWKNGHSPKTHAPLDLAEKFIDVTVKSDWLSPLLFGLAPLAFFLKPHRRIVGWLWIYVAYLFLTWWIFTHRIDRFWVPMIPVVALLAGAGATWSVGRLWRSIWIGGFFLVALFNLTMIIGPFGLCGYNAYLIDYDRVRQQTENYYAPGIPRLNHDLPPDAKVLCVGNAVVFNAKFPTVYNTVFDYAIFEQWCADKNKNVAAKNWPLHSAEDIRRKLQAEGITHIYVNWEEILRYRNTGSYGYTDFVTPARFEQLQKMGLLDLQWPIDDQSSYARLAGLSKANRADIDSWQPSLITRFRFQPEDEELPAYRRYQIFPVSND